jgi:hypothetical protein
VKSKRLYVGRDLTFKGETVTRSEVTVYEMKRAEKEVSGSRDSPADIRDFDSLYTINGKPNIHKALQ